MNPALYGDLVDMRASHVNAGWPADFEGDGPRGISDHDPQVSRFRSRASLTVADAFVTEGDSGTRPMVFTVTLSRPLSQAVLVCAATVDLIGRSGSDYNPLATCRTLAAGQTSLTFTVNVRGDKRKEPNETFALAVAAIPGVALADPIGIGTIVDDD